MNKNIRLAIMLSPFYEKKIIEGLKDENELLKMFREIDKNAKLLKNSTLFVISNDICLSFKNPVLKTYVAKWRGNSQENILIYSGKIECKNIMENKIIDIDNYYSKNLLEKINKNRFPIIIDENKEKIKLKNCNCLDFKICNENEMDVEDIFSIDLKQIKEKVSDLNLPKWYLDISELNLEKIKEFFYILGNLKNIPQEKLSIVEELGVADELIMELKEKKQDELFDILSTMLRTIIFKSASNPQEREEYSIDYHSNTQIPMLEKYINNEKVKFIIQRVDVLGWNGVGMGRSGIRRLVFSEIKQKKKFLYYTNNHEEATKIILEKRL